MITETHQCPLCSHLLTADEAQQQYCEACGGKYLPKQIKTVRSIEVSSPDVSTSGYFKTQNLNNETNYHRL